MLIDSYEFKKMYGDGMGLSAAHKAYESSQIIDAFDKIERLNKGRSCGVDPKEIERLSPRSTINQSTYTQLKKLKPLTISLSKYLKSSGLQCKLETDNAAMAEISTKVKLGDVTPENVKLIMERYKVTDPEQQQMVLDHYQLESKKMSQAGMETYNTQVDSRTAKSNQRDSRDDSVHKRK